MSDIAIKVRNVSKKYYIGEKLPQRSITNSIKNSLKLPWQLTKKMLKGEKFDQREEFWALKDVSFDVKQGEVLGIIGRNGAGKSTLLKILSRITAPTTGEIEIFGRVGCLLEVGTGFHPELTGHENIFLNGSLLGMSKAEIKRRFDEIVDFSGVERFIDTPVKYYSSGMYTRLAFSVAAHLNPEILIVDEVLAVGDAEFQKKCLGKMDSIAKAGRTIIFVSHNMEAIKSLCHTGVLLNNGKILCSGEINCCIDQYSLEIEKNISVNNPVEKGGSGGVEIKAVWIENSSKEQIEIIENTQENYFLCMRIELTEYYRGKNIAAGFGIDTQSGLRVFTCVSSWINHVINTKEKELVIKSKIEHIPLVMGDYLLSASVLYFNETLCCLVHCAKFSIIKHMKTSLNDSKHNSLAAYGYINIDFEYSQEENTECL